MVGLTASIHILSWETYISSTISPMEGRQTTPITKTKKWKSIWTMENRSCLIDWFYFFTFFCLLFYEKNLKSLKVKEKWKGKTAVNNIKWIEGEMFEVDYRQNEFRIEIINQIGEEVNGCLVNFFTACQQVRRLQDSNYSLYASNLRSWIC